MIAQPFWITGSLAIVPRPRGGNWLDDEMLALRDAGIDVVVSMIEPQEAAELGLTEEGPTAKRAGLIFANFTVADRSVPSDKKSFVDFLTKLEKHQAAGKHIGIHCRGCIGRASVTAASLLIRSGIAPETAWNQISSARGCEVPDTKEQYQWVNNNMKSNG